MNRPTHLRVIADPTPGVHRTDSDDITWWLPILGPTATWLAHSLARHATHQPDTRWPTDLLARSLGLGASTPRLWASLDRLDRFEVAHFVATDTLTIRLQLPELDQWHLDRLPAALAAAYHHTHTDTRV
jgi:hypothetical protein